ncbi:YceI family protein [Solitalea canadensis]|nr:YceI family protein [Solitalea canadensis]
MKILIGICLLSLPLMTSAQQKISASESKVMVKGTSTLHDWRCKVEQLSGELQAEKSGTTLKSIKAMQMQMVVKSMKSLKEDGKYYDSGMDKNVYKSLNADKYPQIVFNLKKVNSISTTGDVNAIAQVTIAGVAKDIVVTGNAKVLGNGAVKITGKKEMKMTDFSITPPKAMLGAIKTGDDISIEFDVVYK